MESSRLERSIESKQAFCLGAKPENEQPLRAKPEDAPEVLGFGSLSLGTACTAYLETQAYFDKLQGHPPQFWYCETCKMGMLHSCHHDSTAPFPSASWHDQGSLGLIRSDLKRSPALASAIAPIGCKTAPKLSEKEPCTLSKLSSSPLLPWMAACCLIGASALAL